MPDSQQPHGLHQAPPSMGFSRQEDWSGVPLPSPQFYLKDDKILQFYTLNDSLLSQLKIMRINVKLNEKKRKISPSLLHVVRQLFLLYSGQSRSLLFKKKGKIVGVWIQGPPEGVCAIGRSVQRTMGVWADSTLSSLVSPLSPPLSSPFAPPLPSLPQMWEKSQKSFLTQQIHKYLYILENKKTINLSPDQ